MDYKYIFAIVAVSLFAFLLLISFIMLVRKRKIEARLHAYLCEMYADRNLVKTDYDFSEDEDALNTVTVREARSGGEDYVEQQDVSQQFKSDDVYGKFEIEGIEEITGNYKPQ